MGLTPTKMAIIKKTENNKCFCGCGEIRTLIYDGENMSCAAILENSLEVPQKDKQRHHLT